MWKRSNPESSSVIPARTSIRTALNIGVGAPTLGSERAGSRPQYTMNVRLATIGACPACASGRSPLQLIQSTGRPRLWAMLGALSLAASGCGSMPPPPCACAERVAEIEHLQQDVAGRDAELRELRSDQRAQVKVLQESRRETTRAKAKLRRLATRADAASYIAEVEVAMELVRSSHAAGSSSPQLLKARRLLESTEAPFEQGAYGVAIDRAAEAEHLIALVAGERARPASSERAQREAQRRVKPLLKSNVARAPREQSLGHGPGVDTIKGKNPSVARTHQRVWIQAEIEGVRRIDPP
jgi:hypothetical protein